MKKKGQKGLLARHIEPAEISAYAKFYYSEHAVEATFIVYNDGTFAGAFEWDSEVCRLVSSKTKLFLDIPNNNANLKIYTIPTVK